MRMEWRRSVFVDEIERHLHEDDILIRLETEDLSIQSHKHTNTIKEINKINFRFDIIMGKPCTRDGWICIEDVHTYIQPARTRRNKKLEL